MNNYKTKEVSLESLEKLTDSELIEQANELHPCDYDGDIIITESGELVDGMHRVAGLVAYHKNLGVDYDNCYLKVVVMPGSAKCIGIVGDNWHRLHNVVTAEVVRMAKQG